MVTLTLSRWTLTCKVCAKRNWSVGRTVKSMDKKKKEVLLIAVAAVLPRCYLTVAWHICWKYNWLSHVLYTDICLRFCGKIHSPLSFPPLSARIFFLAMLDYVGWPSAPINFSILYFLTISEASLFKGLSYITAPECPYNRLLLLKWILALLENL